MKYDEVVEYLGEFGPYQKRVFFFACLPAVTASIHALLPVFILSVPDFRCAVPGLSNDTYDDQGKWHQQLINYTLPWTQEADEEDTTWGKAECSVFKNRTASNYGDSFDHGTNRTTSCDRWVYDNSVFDSTFAIQEDLVCDQKVLRTHANMIYMCGLLAGSFIFGFVSDGLGRRTAFMIALVLHFGTSVALCFSNSYIYFVVLRFFNGVSNLGNFMCCFVLAMELVGKSWRAQAGIAINFFWCFGMFVLNFVAFFVREWRTLQLIFSCYTFVYWLLYFIVPESPRWQISQGQVDKARATVEKAAKVNGKELPPGALDSLENKTESKGKISEIFASPILGMRLIVVFLNWLVVTMVYYGLTLNVGSIGGNVFVNFALTAAVETLGNMATLIAVPRFGRKRFHVFAMLLGGTACLASIIPVIAGGSTPLWVILILSNIGKFGATGGFSTIYVFTAELFPTPLRNSVVGASSTVARLGGIAAPYIADLGVLVGGKFGVALPYVVFGAASLVVGLMVLVLPETLNVPTPETIEDAINLGREKPVRKEMPTPEDSQTESNIKITNGHQVVFTVPEKEK